jgi:hypothetical protein
MEKSKSRHSVSLLTTDKQELVKGPTLPVEITAVFKGKLSNFSRDYRVYYSKLDNSSPEILQNGLVFMKT